MMMRAWLIFVAVMSIALLSSGIADATSRGITIKDHTGHVVGGYSGSYALLIGESDYTAGWPDLQNIPFELKQVEQVLTEQGFTVTKVINSNAAQLKNAFSTFISRHGYDANNRLLFYYSGHGYTRNHGKKGYLVPTDAPDPRKDEKGFLRKSLNMSQILAWSREMEAKHALFLFDSCFSGTIFKARALPAIPPQISAMTARPVRQFITAGSAGETVPARSVFTPAFVDGIKYGQADLNNDGYISGTELGLYLQQEVPQHARETPQYGKISDYDLSRGDFIMLAQGSVVESAPQSASEPSKLRILTRPNGAMVFVDGRQMGPAPLTLTKLKGRVVISARLAGYGEASKRVRLRVGKSMKITLLLDKMITTGAIRILSTPAGAEWYLDNDYMGTTPDTALNIKPGNHTIKVTKQGSDVWQQSVQVRKGQTSELVASLNRQVLTHALTINATPSDARIRILNIGPKYRPGIQLQPGNYHIEVSRSGYERVDAWIALGDADLVHSVTLNKAATTYASRPSSGGSSTVAGIAMVSIPSGSFMMGSYNGNGDERPVHRVNINSFKMGKYEVTQSQWQSVMGSNPSNFKGDNRPVEQVSWDDIQTFIRKLNSQTGQHFRLPSEAEWEYAARAKTNTKYSWGNDISCDKASYDGGKNSSCYHKSGGNYRGTQSVGSYAPNSYGLYDMHGNVREWVGDWYHDSYNGAPTNGVAWESGIRAHRVLRGGGWFDTPFDLRSTHRNRYTADGRSGDIGFRLVLD